MKDVMNQRILDHLAQRFNLYPHASQEAQELFSFLEQYSEVIKTIPDPHISSIQAFILEINENQCLLNFHNLNYDLKEMMDELNILNFSEFNSNYGYYRGEFTLFLYYSYQNSQQIIQEMKDIVLKYHKLQSFS